MPQHISIDDVRHVAKLARLAIPDDKLPEFTRKLETILGYVDQLKEVNVEGVEPTSHAIKMSNVLRQDEPTAALDVEAVLQNAPQRDGRFFQVPKVIGGDEDSAG
jgi:aspartyl-tRNA(Asn)/glutamyl-tRNA(Gln) amidotransferase subunit C